MSLEDFDYEVEVKTPLYPTEDKETVVQCLSNIFPKTNWSIEDDQISGESRYLTRFKKILKDMRIRDTARDHLKRKTVGDECSFILSKQASCNEKINFSDEDQPLGGIEVTIYSQRINELIEEITEVKE